MIGIFGGSGFYSLLEDAVQKNTETKYGFPSSPVSIGKIAGRDVAFIARHGLHHEYPPHKIPYKANIAAFHELGVRQIIAPAAVGSLKAEIKPGDFLVPDQFVNFTHREDTFYDELVTHISSAEPYCPLLRRLLTETAEEMGLRLHKKGTVVVINGPRFASLAESSFFQQQRWDIINMTQYPELILAREKEICYANISIITDYDNGLKSCIPLVYLTSGGMQDVNNLCYYSDATSLLAGGDKDCFTENPNVKPVTLEEVIRVFRENNEKIKKLLHEIVPKMPEKRSCLCAKALEGARF